MVLGTTSDAGKTVITTGLCRALARRGVRVAPFKAQNMSNNSMVTADGAEIGRAQWIQALAARARPEAAMNPVLLKPGSDLRSHVVVMGAPARNLEAGEFAGGRADLARAAYDAFDDLAARYDVVVCEGAGSPAEINLRAHDFVNMGLARHAGMPALLVGDIDRGGVLAAMHGTLALLDEADQALVAGLVVNRFRGDLGLLRPGLDTITSLTGRPVLGVVPWLAGMWLDSEDSLAVPERASANERPAARLQVAVVRLPRISNFTDLDALCIEPGLDVTFVADARSLASADVVVIPGTRATIADLTWMRARGLDLAVLDHAARGGVVLGICGGFQILGREVADPEGVEGPAGTRVPGLGLLDATTTFSHDKVLATTAGRSLGAAVSGYEVHHGRVKVDSGDEFPGGTRQGGVFGTMWHGCLEADAFRAAWLDVAAELVGHGGPVAGEVSFAAARECRLDAIADALEEHLDLDAVWRLVEHGPPPLPRVRGGVVP
ncbi:cobyric acid synthase [Nocardioides sp. GCM10027113]|uniref:cobyric acid synthase n=1 Tax=unclassified Nocardioides TaxID=2615069 RepID=UPI00361CDF5C